MTIAIIQGKQSQVVSLSLPWIGQNSESPSSQQLSTQKHETAMDWRRRRNMTRSLEISSNQSNELIRLLSKREHAPGARNQGCPCCDTDVTIDSMMTSL